MRTWYVTIALALAVLLGSALHMNTVAAPSKAAGKSKVGGTAPDFTLKDTFGKEFKLSEFKGKIIVLEWLNPDCPVSKGHHNKKTMQDTYKKYAENVVWLGIDTTDGNKPESDRVYAAKMGLAYPVLLDTDGHVGHLYGAKTTPHMFVIDKHGKLAYEGAIDDKGGTNYVAQVIDDLEAGKTVSKSTEPYGCHVHYPK